MKPVFRTTRVLAVAAMLLPAVVSCSSLRDGDADEDAGPPKLSERISNLDRSKQFNTKTLDINESYSNSSTDGNKRAKRSPFQSQRVGKMKTAETNRFNTERYTAESAQKKVEKKWYHFTGERSKQQKSSWFGKRRSTAESDVYATGDYTTRSKIEGLYGSRSERDVTGRYFRNEVAGEGAPSPTVIREPTMSEGDIRALLKGP